jgi:sarcosine oxidase delta subunit
MMEVLLTLDFACCHCSEPVVVTLKCAGEEAALRRPTEATVAIPCPHCSAVLNLDFEPTGTLRAVRPRNGRRPIPQPSWN